MAIKILHRRDTAAEFTSENPTVNQGELCFETDTNKIKVGDGSTSWTSLPYITEQSFLDADHAKLNGIETGATADQTQADINALGITATSVDLGNWTITENAGVMYFATGGTDKMKLDASGNLTVVGDVAAFGTI